MLAGASSEFRFGGRNIQQKNTQSLLKLFCKIYIKLGQKF